MTTDLTYLVWTVALTIVHLLVTIGGAMSQFAMQDLAGNRERPIECRGWVGRAQRAHRNMLESVGLFAALVLVAHVSGRANVMTALGAEVFFYGRLAYAFIYWFGVPWIRSLVFGVSMIGLTLILLQLF
jgi:uncharacterized MAPEG superfamily protein